MPKKVKLLIPSAAILMLMEHRGKVELSFPIFLAEFLFVQSSSSTHKTKNVALPRAKPSVIPASDAITRTVPAIVTTRGPGPWL